MGSIWLHRLPEFFDRWDVPYTLNPGWEKLARKSGGLSSMRGINIHHSGSPKTATLASAVRYCTITSDVAPIGNGTVTRPIDGPRIVLWAAGASNTAGKGGPRLSSRGLIPLDAANGMTVALEAENNGTNEMWAPEVQDLYVRACAAVIDWANTCTPGAPLTAGDVFAHHEWAPGRKIDPAGHSRFTWNRHALPWDMDRFRGEVWMLLAAGPSKPAPKPEPKPDTTVVTPGDTWLSVSLRLGYSISEVQWANGTSVLTVGDTIHRPGYVPPAEPLAAGTPIPTISPGDAGPHVGNLIDVLRFWGWHPNPGTPNDWLYGADVVTGVVTAQTALGVVATPGVWGDATAQAYSSFLVAMQALACQLPQPSSPGEHTLNVVALQQFLTRHGWYPYRVDGQYGPRTIEGVQRLQKHCKAWQVYPGPIHGVYDTPTRDAACRVL